MKITKLNTTDTYKLIDKEGWEVWDLANMSMLGDYPEMLTGFKLGGVKGKEGWYKDDVVIKEDEYSFFEIITPSDTTEHKGVLWDGVSDIEVDMVVKDCNDNLCTAVMLEEDLDQAVLRMQSDKSLIVTRLINIKRASKTHKELTFDKVMSAWKGQGLDFAHDSKDSTATIERVFEVVYEVMKGEANDT